MGQFQEGNGVGLARAKGRKAGNGYNKAGGTQYQYFNLTNPRSHSLPQEEGLPVLLVLLEPANRNRNNLE